MGSVLICRRDHGWCWSSKDWSDYQRQEGDGIELVSNSQAVNVDLATYPGLILTGSSPNKKLSALVSASGGIEIDTSNGLALFLNNSPSATLQTGVGGVSVVGLALGNVLLAASLWRGLGDRSYWRALPERFGFGPRLPAGGLWVHAVSVGEVQAAAALVRPLRGAIRTAAPIAAARRPGAAAREALFGERRRRPLPAVRPAGPVRAISRPRPAAPRHHPGDRAVAEPVPALRGGAACRSCSRARALSERSVRRYRRLGGLTCRMLAQRRRGRGAERDGRRALRRARRSPAARTHVAGNLKFDFRLRRRRGRGRRAPGRRSARRARCGSPAARTRARRRLLLDAHARLRRARRPTRCSCSRRAIRPASTAVAALLERSGSRSCAARAARRSRPRPRCCCSTRSANWCPSTPPADVAFVGGSLVPVGGHNLLEPAALGEPGAHGPYTANAAGRAAQLEAAGALEVVRGRAGARAAAGRAVRRPGAAARARRATPGARSSRPTAAPPSACSRSIAARLRAAGARAT